VSGLQSDKAEMEEYFAEVIKGRQGVKFLREGGTE
jgi:hypothetical protein